MLSSIANTHGHFQTAFIDDVADPIDLAFDQALEVTAKAIYIEDYAIVGFGDHAA